MDKFLQNLLQQEERIALRDYFSARVAAGNIPLTSSALCEKKLVDGDRYEAYDDPQLRPFLERFTPIVAEVAQRKVKPTYTFFRQYTPNTVLDKHLDRPQCRYTISVLVDYAPIFSQTIGWPLYIETDPVSKVDLGLGDGVMFRGREYRHWRDPLPEGHTACIALFHYVPKEFMGSLR